MPRFFTTRCFALALAAGVGVSAFAPEADAKRIGGGRSIGKQSTNVDRQAAPAQPAAPAQQQSAATAKPATPPAAAPAPARNRWLGPLAGLAAGLGIAALLSHFGFGGAFAEAMMTFLLIGLALMAVMLLLRMWRSRNTPAMAGAGASQPMMRTPLAETPGPAPIVVPAIGSGAAQAAPGGATWHLPADFDVDNFLHIAKMYFVRLQAAWDRGDDSDLRNFTTPEMYAHLKVELTTREGESFTEVVKVEAQLLGLEDEGETTLASVRLSGLIRESKDGAAEPFIEVWNLQKPATARASWVLAGIQQEAHAA